MKVLIIPEERVEKLKSIEFPKPHKLSPVSGELDGKQVYFLTADVKDNKIFANALADFEVCEIKEVESVEEKYFDEELKEITDVSKIDIAVSVKTVLNVRK